MKANQIIKTGLIVVAGIIIFLGQSCQKFDYSDFNNPSIADDTANATASVLQTLVTGTEASSRTYLSYFIDDAGVIGREYIRYSNSDPRYLSDLPGGSELNNNTFYITNPWAYCYSVVKDANVLISAARNSTQISSGERLGYYAYAKTMQAYQLLMVFDLTDSIRTNVTNPDNLGPIVGHETALSFIAGLLDEAATELQDPSCSFIFKTTIASSGPVAVGTVSTPADFLLVNKALAARVAAYREQWQEVLTDLGQSFLNRDGDLYAGAFHVFANASNDITNPLFLAQNSGGEVRGVEEHYAPEILPGDDRIDKAPLRDAPITQQGFTSDRDVFIYTTNTSPIAIIRNEELILLAAEAEIQLGQTPDAVNDLNIIRTAHGLDNYSGATDHDSLITEMLYERRYSLAFEGHRWVDLRRYNLLNTLPINRPDDHVWKYFPIPFSETH